MLRISRHQFAVLQNAAIHEADERLAGYARERFRLQFVGRPLAEVVEFASAVRQKARAYGVVVESDVATALDFTVMYGSEFYSAEWARDVFDTEEWDGTHRMDVLRRRASRQLNRS